MLCRSVIRTTSTTISIDDDVDDYDNEIDDDVVDVVEYVPNDQVDYHYRLLKVLLSPLSFPFRVLSLCFNILASAANVRKHIIILGVPFTS